MRRLTDYTIGVALVLARLVLLSWQERQLHEAAARALVAGAIPTSAPPPGPRPLEGRA